MDNNKVESVIHTANIYNREKIDIIGVSEVFSSTSNEVIAKVCDYIMQINGSNLRISKLLPEEKFLSIYGKIDAIKYDKHLNKKSFIGKVFKWCFLKIFLFSFL